MQKFEPRELETKIMQEFAQVYRASSGFISTDSILRQLCFKAIHDQELFMCIRFVNDYLQIQPVYSFLKYMEKEVNNLGARLADEYPGPDGQLLLPALAKQSVGAFWGFVFKDYLGYQSSVNKNMPGQIYGFRTASFFL